MHAFAGLGSVGGEIVRIAVLGWDGVMRHFALCS
jgi:hypothetical protein